MIHLPRRHFFQARNEKHYKKRGSKMGGPIYPINDPVQDTIDSLNAAIDRLDKIINDMKGQTNGNNK